MKLWCWSVTFVVVQIVPENPDPEVADESPSKLAASEVSTMLLEGNSTDACKKLADELCNEVEQSVKSSQQGIQALPDGSQCKFEGQEEVEQNKQEVVRTETESKEAADRAEEAAKATVDFGSFTLSSLDESLCSQFWKDDAYIAAKGNAEEAKEASREAKIAWNSATERLQESILRAANKERECLCNVQRDYNNAYSTATKNIDEEAKAYAKCNHMKCYLENTPADNCEFVVPTVSPRKFQDVPNSCDQILNIQKDADKNIKKFLTDAQPVPAAIQNDPIKKDACTIDMGNYWCTTKYNIKPGRNALIDSGVSGGVCAPRYADAADDVPITCCPSPCCCNDLCPGVKICSALGQGGEYDPFEQLTRYAERPLGDTTTKPLTPLQKEKYNRIIG